MMHRVDWTGPRASSATAYAWFGGIERIAVRLSSTTDIKSVVAGNARRILSALGIRGEATR
jgi:hypothetical protein